MFELALNLPIYQALIARRRKALILPAAGAPPFRRHDGVRVTEVRIPPAGVGGPPEPTGEWCLARVTWVEYTDDRMWVVLSVEPVTPTLVGIGPPPHPSQDPPTRPETPYPKHATDAPIPCKPPPRDDGE